MTATNASHRFKHTQHIPRAEMKQLLAVSRGDAPADLLLENVRVLDLVHGHIIHTSVAIWNKWIAGVGTAYTKAHKTIDVQMQFIVPGFIDSHTHIESSMMHPFAFEQTTLPLGTTTVICDPHEITNVLGKEGISWFLRCSERMTQNLFVQVSSCVPALPGFETTGSTFDLPDMLPLKNHPHVLGLAEMMNYSGVIYGDDAVLDKIDAFADGHLDGHAPMLRGQALQAYRVAGIENCHESVSLAEAHEKLQWGFSVMLREGSVAKNLDEIAPVVHAYNSMQCLLCTDDRNPYEIAHEGHLNYMLKKLMQDHKMPPHLAYRLSSFAAARHFGLKRLGLIAPGYQADFVLLNNLEAVDITAVYARGHQVNSETLNHSRDFAQTIPPLHNTVNRAPVSADAFIIPQQAGMYNVMEVIPNQITTNHLKVKGDGLVFEHSDVQQIAVVERHGHQRPIVNGLVTGFGLTRGAIAASVAHDSHNLIVVGCSPAEMAVAVNHLITLGGGFCAVEEANILADLPLPIGGLMSLSSAPTIAQELTALKVACATLGITLHEPFLQMAFLSLPVIPSLKITDYGLVADFQVIPLCHGF